jgi:chromosome partitioning protein
MAELVISCLSQKGGVGKSTLSRLIATAYAQAGWAVKICDFNTKQKTSVDWVAARLENKIEPAIASEPYSSVKQFSRENYDLLVVDGKPDSDVSSLDAARLSHLVIIPTDVATDDLRPQVLFANELVAKGVDRRKIVFVLNKSQAGTVYPKAARDFIAGAGYQTAENELRRLVPYSEAQNTGRSIMETTNEDLNGRARAVAEELVSVLEKIKEAA